MKAKAKTIVARILSGLKFNYLKEDDSDLGKVDFGVLTVAMMVAALDGRIMDDEFKSFDKIAGKIRGATPERIAETLEKGLRAAGYLELQARRLPRAELIAAFVDEAEKALPKGFVAGNVVDLRRAFAMWVAMSMADGEFSAVEREAIAAFRARLAGLMKLNETAVERTWHELSPTFAMTYAADGKSNRPREAPSADFLDRVEAQVAQLAAPERHAAAMKELKRLIAEG